MKPSGALKKKEGKDVIYLKMRWVKKENEM